MTSTVTENNKRIAKNTMYLYLRMLLIMGVTLYTSRVVLQVLGVEDFGIYNVVGGIVVLFTFVNNAMVTSTQRFLNYELGKGDLEATKQVFSASVTIHWGIAILTLILAETIGLWFLKHYIQYPEEREIAVNFTYQFTILSTCVSIIRTPYNAAIIAHERMSFYAYISIVEVLLRLLIVYLLTLVDFDRLIFYSILMFLIIWVVTIGYYVYSRVSFIVCRYNFFLKGDIYKRLMSFSGWSLLGGVANMGASQGVNILLNLFYGVAINAAMGIANQVQTAVYSFVANFQTAFNPQIVKSYAAGNRDYFINLIIRSSKFSYFLLYIISLPIYLFCEEILMIWLGEVPAYTVSFCRLMIIFSLLDAIQGPLWISVQATGKIRNYQILMSVMILLNLPLSYLFLKLGYVPEIVLIIRCLLNIIILFVRLFYLRCLYGFPILVYVREVIVRVIYVTLPTALIIYIPLDMNATFFDVLIASFVVLLFILFIVYFVGLNLEERKTLHLQLKKIVERWGCVSK